MQSGKLRYRVILERRVDTQSEGGQVVHSYTPITPNGVWAGIRPLSGREFIAAQQVQSDISAVITIRWRDDVDETCRIRRVLKANVSPPVEEFYDIVAPLADEQTNRRELNLMCVRRRAEGFRNVDV